jgi:hypothetical protein
MRRADKLTRAATLLVVAALAVTAGAISFSHMSALALAHGQLGWKSTAFPISVDGLELVSSLYILTQRRARRRAGLLPWTALVVGTAASLAANVAVGGADPVGRALAGWPAISLLVSIKLLFSMFDHDTEDRPPVPDGPSVPGPVPETVLPDQRTIPDRPAVPETVPGTVRDNQPPFGTAETTADPGCSSTAAPATGDTGPAGGGTLLGPRDVADLLPAARQARAALAAGGRTLSRDRLADRMREDGYGVSNARAGLLLKSLRAEGLAVLAEALPASPAVSNDEDRSGSR